VKPNDDVKQYKFGCVFRTASGHLGVQYEDKKRKRSITVWPQYVVECSEDKQAGGWMLYTSCSFADRCPEHLAQFLREKHGYHVVTHWNEQKDEPELLFVR